MLQLLERDKELLHTCASAMRLHIAPLATLLSLPSLERLVAAWAEDAELRCEHLARFETGKGDRSWNALELSRGLLDDALFSESRAEQALIHIHAVAAIADATANILLRSGDRNKSAIHAVYEVGGSFMAVENMIYAKFPSYEGVEEGSAEHAVADADAVVEKLRRS